MITELFLVGRPDRAEFCLVREGEHPNSAVTHHSDTPSSWSPSISMLSRARSPPQILQVQRRSCSTTSEVLFFIIFFPFSRYHDHITPPADIDVLRCPFSLQSGRHEHNESLSILALDLQARVQLWLRRRLRRLAPDDPTRRV